MATPPVRRGLRLVQSLCAAGALIVSLAAGAATSGAPVRVGGTLALTGPLAPTGLIHRIVGEIYVDQVNRRDGFLGRPVEWVLLDDQSKPDLARTLYEKLVTVDRVDLLMGPYATGGILSAMAVAERHGKLLIHNTLGIPKLAKYDRQIPVYSIGAVPEQTFPTTLFDALAANGKTPKNVAFVTSKFPSVHFMSVGAREVAKKRGISESLWLEFDFGTRDFGPIAARIRDANPDFLWVGSIGLEGNQLLEALKKLDYTPKNPFFLYPSPGPLAQSPDAANALSLTLFEDHAPFTNTPQATEFAKLYRERAAKAGITYVDADMQAAVAYAGWQALEAAVTATRSLDDAKLAQWLKANRVDTLIGRLRFDGPGNYGDDLQKVKQVQNGRWITVWPREFAPPGAKMNLQ
jgi:branched-chain amino acid transport system substrate-binding protein